LSRTEAGIKEFWKEMYKVWFPGGPEDSDLALIVVNPPDGPGSP
jgi:general stress protein 26